MTLSFNFVNFFCLRKRKTGPEQIHDELYFELGNPEPAVSSEYECIGENVYSYIKYDRKHENDASSDVDNGS